MSKLGDRLARLEELLANAGKTLTLQIDLFNGTVLEKTFDYSTGRMGRLLSERVVPKDAVQKLADAAPAPRAMPRPVADQDDL